MLKYESTIKFSESTKPIATNSSGGNMKKHNVQCHFLIGRSETDLTVYATWPASGLQNGVSCSGRGLRAA